MAIANFFAAPDNTTDANFRAWGSGISAALAACGLVQTGDTGQINWTTVTRPLSAVTYQGFEIWRFNDSLQATCPVFIKIRYGSGGNNQYPGVEITVGQATNGAGTLTGFVTDPFILATGQSSSAIVLPCYVSGSTNRLTVALFAGVTGGTYIICFSVARTKTAAGADNSDGVNVTGTAQGSSRQNQQFLPNGAAKYPSAGALTQFVAVLPPGSNPTGNYGGEMGVFPIVPFRGFPDYPDLGLLIYNTNDAGYLQTLPVYILGSVHNFLTVGLAGGGSVGQMASGASFAMRYE